VDLLAHQPRALGEQRVVTDDDEACGQPGLREVEAQIGPDAGGLASGDRDLQSLYST
jgi:hypothetical protein